MSEQGTFWDGVRTTPYKRNYYSRNREKCNAATRKWEHNNAERVRIRNRDEYKRHRQKRLAQARAYRAANREKIAQANKKWRELNVTRHKQSQIAWAAKAKSRYLALKRTARYRGLQMGITEGDYMALVFGKCCFYCGFSIDWNRGGGHSTDRKDHRKGYTPENIVPCCRSCNWSKSHFEAAGHTYPRTVELLKELLALRAA